MQGKKLFFSLKEVILFILHNPFVTPANKLVSHLVNLKNKLT